MGAFLKGGANTMFRVEGIDSPRTSSVARMAPVMRNPQRVTPRSVSRSLISAPAERSSGRAAPADVYEYLISKGVSDKHAKGMLANIQSESGFDAGINEKNPTVKGSRGGYGLFQHTGPRRRHLEKFAGKDVSNWKKQVDFALSEGDTKRYLSKKFDSSDDAAKWFMVNWERPADQSSAAQNKRVKNLSRFRQLGGPNVLSRQKGKKAKWKKASLIDLG